MEDDVRVAIVNLQKQQDRHSGELNALQLSFRTDFALLEKEELKPLRDFKEQMSGERRVYGFIWKLLMAVAGIALTVMGAIYHQITENNDRQIRIEERQKEQEKTQQLILELLKGGRSAQPNLPSRSSQEQRS
jgi:hypothetical protein